MENPMLSIAMATYNGECFLQEQLDSLLTQTITDFEVVVCDDCSTDNTVAILEGYAKADARFRIYRNEHNIGFKKNFEQAIKRCKGDYIALCDQDDIWYPNHLELLLDNIGDCVLCCGNSELVDSENKSLGRMLSDNDKFYHVPQPSRRLIYKLFYSGNPMQGASMLICSDFVRKSLPIPNGVGFHDAWLACCGCLEEKGISYFFEPITRYRQHEHNVTVAANREYVDTFYTRMQKGLRLLCTNASLETDRWSYIDGLKTLYKDDKDVTEIADVMEDLLKGRKITLWKHFWNHYDDLVLTVQKSSFLKKFLGVMQKYFVYIHWTPN